jgi:hypothetical protein
MADISQAKTTVTLWMLALLLFLSLLFSLLSNKSSLCLRARVQHSYFVTKRRAIYWVLDILIYVTRVYALKLAWLHSTLARNLVFHALVAQTVTTLTWNTRCEMRAIMRLIAAPPWKQCRIGHCSWSRCSI